MPVRPHPLPARGIPRRTLLAAAGASGLVGVLVACGAAPAGGAPAPAAGGTPQRGGVLRAGAPPAPTAVEPVTMFDGTAVALVQLVAEYLVWLDADLRPVPQLAESWEASDGGSTWTFALRRGVTFSDGTPLDSAAVVATFERLLDPEQGSAALSAFATVLAPGGVSAPDASTVVFRLERPFADFPYLVSAGNYNAVVLKADYAGDFTTAGVGTGPFTLTSFDATRGASFARNPTYWDPERPYLDGVEVRFYADDQADLLALQSGEIDAQLLSRPALVGPLAGTGDLTVDTVRGTGFTALTLRTDQAPFDRKEVRQAVAYALRRADVLSSIGSGVGDLANDHLFAPLFPGAPTDITQREQDAERVRELLAAAGAEGLRFPLTFDTTDRDYAVTIQSQLAPLGITVDLDERTPADFYGGDQATDTPWLFTPANLVGWAARAVPSQLIVPMVLTDGRWNGSKYSNPELDAAAAAYDASADEAERATQAGIIARALHEDVPVIISYWSGSVRASRSTAFTGVRAHPSSFVDLRSVARA